MNGITTALVMFILLALAFPTLIKNKHQFHFAFLAVVAIIVLDALAHIAGGSGAFVALMYALCAALQIIALLMLFFCVGGIGFSEFKSDMGDAFEVLRRGETRPEIIVPVSDELRSMGAAQAEARRRAAPPGEGSSGYVINDPSPVTPPPPGPSAGEAPAQTQDHGPLPLD